MTRMSHAAPNVVVIAGPNGSGKTTSAPRLLPDYLGIQEFVNADAIASGLSAFRPEAVAVQAGRVMLQRLNELAERKVSFAFETTLATRSFALWLAARRASGYRVHILFLWLRTPELAVARVARRVAQGGHSVPDDVVRRRYYRGLENFFTLYQPIADSWTMLDNSGPARPQPIAVGLRDGRTSIVDPEMWRRIRLLPENLR